MTTFSMHRYLQRERYVRLELYRPILTENVVTFYLYNLSGQIIGYQSHQPNVRNRCGFNLPENRYYTYRKLPTITMFGTETLGLHNGPIFLTEGLFDSCRFSYFGYSSLATLCNDPPKDYLNYLKCLGRPIIAVCDNDKAGLKLAKLGDYVEVVTDYKDVGEASQEYVLSLIDKYS